MMEINEDISAFIGFSGMDKKSKIGLIVIVGSMGIFTVLGSLFALIGFPEGAMMSFAAAFLISILLWIFLSAKQVEKFIRLSEPNIPFKNKMALIIVSISIFAFIIAIFFTGNTIAWWRVRVNQQSYEFSGIIIPKALTTVATTFFSSILLLTWTTLRKVSIQADDLRKAELNNENPLLIIERRERYISKTTSSVGKKGLIFVALIGVTIVFASDLSVYATQGILIIVPFILTAFITLIVASLYQKKTKTPIEIVLDNVFECAYCGVNTPVGGTYCENCGKKLVLGNRLDDGFLCENCGNINTKGSQFCRYCSQEIGSKIKEKK